MPKKPTIAEVVGALKNLGNMAECLNIACQNLHEQIKILERDASQRAVQTGTEIRELQARIELLEADLSVLRARFER